MLIDYFMGKYNKLKFNLDRVKVTSKLVQVLEIKNVNIVFYLLKKCYIIIRYVN